MTDPPGQAVRTWRYYLPKVKGEGWAIVFLDSIGCFSALSDWGNVGYRWPQAGWGDGDFRDFLLDCDNSYLESKFGQERREYDPEATVESVRNGLLRARREGYLTKEEARDEWNLLRRHFNLSDESDFSEWFSETKVDAAGEHHHTRYVREVTSFIEHVMPRLREQMKLDRNGENNGQP